MIPHTKPSFGKEEAEACYDYMISGNYVTEFKYTKQFERMIEEFTGAKHCIVVNNGTISLTIAFLALDLQPGDEIIIPNLTMVASLNAATLIGLKPIFVDVTSSTLTLDTSDLQKFITPGKTKAVLHVSLNGKCGNLNELREFCDLNNLYLIEDAAQSFGSFYDNKHLGTIGHIGSFSFSIPKIISTGQGGALITNDDEIADKIRKIKNFGRAGGGDHNYEMFGINAKFTDIQAVIGIEQMKKLPERIKRKKEIWKLYLDELNTIDEIEILNYTDDGWVPWVIDIYTENRDDLLKYLKEKGIDTREQYPVLRQLEKFSVSEYYSSRGVWLPATMEITNDEIKYICNCLEKYFCEHFPQV